MVHPLKVYTFWGLLNSATKITTGDRLQHLGRRRGRVARDASDSVLDRHLVKSQGLKVWELGFGALGF